MYFYKYIVIKYSKSCCTMWFYDISKRSITKRCDRLRSTDVYYFTNFFTYQRMRIFCSRLPGQPRAEDEELCMTHRQIRIPSDDSFFLSFTNVAGRLQEPKWHWLMSSHRALTGTCKCVLGYVARIIIPARPFTAGNLTCDESQKG